ncbi:MAG TPA: hypothetical protein VEE85_00525 [Candidatus Bathyarchaeia archaeon]|nr:hypothetical protein [Candidatus Bathyarchaeia archaeon]
MVEMFAPELSGAEVVEAGTEMMTEAPGIGIFPDFTKPWMVPTED